MRPSLSPARWRCVWRAGAAAMATLVWDSLTYLSCREEISWPAPGHSELRCGIVCSRVDARQRRQENPRCGPLMVVSSSDVEDLEPASAPRLAQPRGGSFPSAWASGTVARKGRAMATKSSGAS